MTYSPKSTEEVRESLQSSLSGKIVKLTNFTNRSFNYVFINSISNYLREIELKLLASELSGYIDYAGGPITNEDLRRLEIEDAVDADELNQYMDDSQLDNLVDIVGIERDSGNKATGFIDISTTSDSVSVPKGTTVSTSPDSSGNTLSYKTLEEGESSEGQSEIIDVPVVAESFGSEYNIPANQLVRFSSPPIGVRGIDSSTDMNGGRDEETNDELRSRAKNRFSDEPTGGTTRGIRGYIISEVSDITADDIGITELFSKEPVVVEVTVDGGSTEDIRTAIDESRPVGVKHELIRPKTISVSVSAQVLGSGVDYSFASSEIEQFLTNELAVGDSFYQKNLVKEIIESDSNIINIDQLSTTIDTVENERIEYNTSQSIYSIDFNYDGGEITVYTNEDDGTQTIYEEGVDYQLVDSGNDGLFDKIEWLGVTEPEDKQDFYLDYTVYQESDEISEEEHTFVDPQADDITFDNEVFEYKLSKIPTESTISIVDEDGISYTKGTDYELVNTSVGSNKHSFVFSSGRSLYQLNNSAFADSVTVYIDDSTTYVQGTDYQVIDNDGDGLTESIEWIDGGESPSDNQEFIVEYEINNGLEQTIRWDDTESTPSVGDVFTVEYQQQVYELDNEVSVVTPDNISCNCPSSEYVLGTDFKFVDVNADTEKDAIYWIDGNSNPSDGVTFFVTYKSEGDIKITEQEKIGASNVTITEK